MGSLSRLLLVLLAVSQLAAECPGTETGNPGKSSQTNRYSNSEQGVSANYEDSWSYTDNLAPNNATTPSSDTGGGGTSGTGGTTASGINPTTSPPDINTAKAPSTVFTDGTTSVTVYYVTLNPTPASLQTYLQGIFPFRIFEIFSNSKISGFTYDNPEAGTTGGDLQEYYFLKDSTLIYVVTDLFTTNNGITNFQTLINSLQF